MSTPADLMPPEMPVIPGEHRPVAPVTRPSRRLGVRLRNYLSNHLTLFLAGIVQLERSPWAAWRTCFALGAMLVLPVVFLAAVVQARDMAAGLGASGEVSVYLRDAASNDDVTRLVGEIQGMDDVAAVKHIPPDEALAELQQSAHIDDALRLLDRNPLPHVLLVTPKEGYVTAERVAALSERIGKMTSVALAEADTAWVERAQHWMETARYVTVGLGLLLVVAVVPTIGNTVRLLIDRRRRDIEVLQLVGASHAYIRRPYLYLGTWTGVLSSVIAWWIVNVVLWIGAPHAAEAASALGVPLRLELLGWGTLWPIAALSGAAGWVAARLAVGRQVRRIKK